MSKNVLINRPYRFLILLLIVPAILISCLNQEDNQEISQSTSSEVINTSKPTPAPTSTIPPSPTPSSTPTPQDVPPIIVATAPKSVSVGSVVIIDASESYDFDGDLITYTWSQAHNPDQFDGNEYISSRVLEVDFISENVIQYVPQWPGKYRFILAAKDKDGETINQFDVLVLPETAIPIRGVGIWWWFGSQSNDAYLNVLDHLSTIGVNWIQFVPIWCQDDLSSENVHLCKQDELYPITVDQITQGIREAKKRNMSVLLKPHLYVDGWQPMYQIQPRNWDTWFESYSIYILEMAELAEEESVEMFSVGTELAQSHTQQKEWISLIEDLKDVYSGKLIYSDICIQRPGLCPAGFPAWEHLDYIGVSFYYNGTCSPQWGCEISQRIPASDDPTLEQMASEIDSQLSVTIDQLQEIYDLPVIASEIGIQNVDGANYEPAGSSSLIIDNQEQADWYEASLQATSARPYWEGYFWWSVDPLPEPFSYDQEAPGKTFDPRFKPAEEVLRIWYRGNIE